MNGSLELFFYNLGLRNKSKPETINSKVAGSGITSKNAWSSLYK
jgi:hypothetical protein